MNAHEQLLAAYLRLHPESVARQLEALPVEQANAVLCGVDVEIAAPVLGAMLPTSAAHCVERQPSAHGASLLERLGSQEAAAVLRHLGGAARDGVLGALGPQWTVAFKLLLSYPVNTVGAWVEPRVLTLPDDCTTGEARERIARSELVAQTRVFVLDRGRRVRGAIRGLTLLQVQSRKALATLLEPAESIWGREPLTAAQEHSVWERHSEAPVVNRDEEFIGVISYADLRKASRQLTRAAGTDGGRDLAEVTELIAVGAGSLLRSLGELVDRERR